MEQKKLEKESGNEQAICILVGASTIVKEDFHFFYHKWKKEQQILLIAVDGGYSFLKRQNLKPDLAVGDFDSNGSVPKDVEVIIHPVQKDDTDMLLAIKEGMKRGFRQFYIFGGLGGRIDHAFANIELLSYLKQQGCRGILFGDSMHMTTIRHEKIGFGKGFSGVVSVFSVSESAKEVSIHNLKYELVKTDLNRTFPLGVSNEFVDKESEIEVGCGELLIMWERKNYLLPKIGREL